MDDPLKHVPLLPPAAWAELGVIAACLVALALISLAEAALVRMGRVRIRQLIEEGHPWAPLLERLADQRQQMLGALVVALNLSIILMSALAASFTIRLWGPRALPYSSLVLLALIVIFCEITPKTYAVRFPERVAVRMAPLVALLVRLLYPAVVMLNATASLLLRGLVVPLLGGKPVPAPPTFSEEEIKQLVTVGQERGELEEEEREMIHGVIEFADKMAREVMVPRVDMVCLEGEVPLAQAAEVFLAQGHSRIPVYHENVDSIVGILYVKDLLLRLQAGQGDLPAIQACRPALVVPETKKIDELLREMQARQTHMGIVIDEYGGTAGLVTIEDLLEQIVGEIYDEHDLVEPPPIRMLNETTALVDGSAPVDEIAEVFHAELPEGDYDTIGGFVLVQLGRLPEPGEKFESHGLEITVERVEQNRIEEVRIVKLEESKEEE